MTIHLSLLDRYSNVHTQAGLNWGYSDGNVCNHDAYIPIKSKTLQDNPGFFNPISNDNRIYVTWDDGVEMELLLEGRQSNLIHGLQYAKQISSYADKSILGYYLRSRLNILDRPITLNDLEDYGRTNIAVTKVTNDTYLFDFS